MEIEKIVGESFNAHDFAQKKAREMAEKLKPKEEEEVEVFFLLTSEGKKKKPERASSLYARSFFIYSSASVPLTFSGRSGVFSCPCSSIA